MSTDIALYSRYTWRFKALIARLCEHPINTGELEGFNNKAKVIKHRFYGFLGLDYFTLMIKQAAPRSRSP